MAVEELLVKISADMQDLKKGLGEAARETKKFGQSVESVDKNIKGFRTQAVGAIQGLGGLENAMDALSGKGALTAGTISQLTQLLPLMASPAGAATTAIGALGIGVMKVVEAERKLKENRTAKLLKDIKEKAEQAAKGWDAYFKAIEDGQSRSEAKRAKALAETSAGIDDSRKKFEENTAALKAQNERLREEIPALEKKIASWDKAAKTIKDGTFDTTQLKEALEKKQKTLKDNEATIAKGYVPALEELADTKAKVTKATKDLTEAEEDQFDPIDEMLKAHMDFVQEDLDAEKAAEAERMQLIEDRMNAQMDLVQMDLDAAKAASERREEIKEENELYADLAASSADAMANVITGAKDGEQAMEDLARAIAEAILKMLILRAVSAMGGPEATFLAPIAGGLIGGATGSGATSSGMTSSGNAASSGGFHYHDHSLAPRSQGEMARVMRDARVIAALEDLESTGDYRPGRSRRSA